MQTVSSTELNRHPARYLRQAQKRPIAIGFHGRPRCVLAPVGYTGQDPLERLTIDDVPSSSRYQRSDTLAWLLAEHASRMLEQFPGRAIEAMRASYRERFKPGQISAHMIKTWGDLLEAGPSAVISALRRDDDTGAHLRQTAPITGLAGLGEREKMVKAANRLFARRKDRGA